MVLYLYKNPCLSYYFILYLFYFLCIFLNIYYIQINLHTIIYNGKLSYN